MVMIRTAPGELLSWRCSLQGLSRETDPFMGIRIRPPGSFVGDIRTRHETSKPTAKGRELCRRELAISHIRQLRAQGEEERARQMGQAWSSTLG